MVFGSLEIVSAISLCESPFASASINVLKTVNWSGVTFKCEQRRRNAWFNPYHDRRSNGGNRRLSGASMGKLPELASLISKPNLPSLLVFGIGKSSFLGR